MNSVFVCGNGVSVLIVVVKCLGCVLLFSVSGLFGVVRCGSVVVMVDVVVGD